MIVWNSNPSLADRYLLDEKYYGPDYKSWVLADWTASEAAALLAGEEPGLTLGSETRKLLRRITRACERKEIRLKRKRADPADFIYWAENKGIELPPELVHAFRLQQEGYLSTDQQGLSLEDEPTEQATAPVGSLVAKAPARPPTAAVQAKTDHSLHRLVALLATRYQMNMEAVAKEAPTEVTAIIYKAFLKLRDDTGVDLVMDKGMIKRYLVLAAQLYEKERARRKPRAKSAAAP